MLTIRLVLVGDLIFFFFSSPFSFVPRSAENSEVHSEPDGILCRHLYVHCEYTHTQFPSV